MATTNDYLTPCRGHHCPDVAGICAICTEARHTTDPVAAIRIPEGLTLSNLLDALDSAQDRRGVTEGRESAYPHSYALGMLTTATEGTIVRPQRGVDHLARTLAKVTLITMRAEQYHHLATMADDRRDAVEHAARLAAERCAKDDGPVAA